MSLEFIAGLALNGLIWFGLFSLAGIILVCGGQDDVLEGVCKGH